MAKSQIRAYVFTPGTAGNGTIIVGGKVDLQQLLVITNTTTNSIIYNFADPTYSGTTVSFTRGSNQVTNFTSVLDNADGYTTITLAVDTSSMSSSHVLQILSESPEQTVRPWPMGTDAFERTRVANPQSLLDADFEYGMQPTKWLTISQQRGVPAIYEVPGTDIAVTAATTDASYRAGGLSTSESIITITTAIAHGYTQGQALTIRGMNSAITGFDRAEGSFIVYQILSTTQFTYIAKGKVGYVNGDNIYTPFIQLRQGGFYTGSQVNAIVNTIATGTASSTNYVTVSTTTGLNQNSAITFNTVTTNAVATNGTNNQITVGSSIGMAVGMPLVFSGNSFGGLASGATYYVASIVDTRTITVVTTSGGAASPTLTTAIGGNMYISGGASFGGLVAGTQYYVTNVIDSTHITVSTNIVYNTTIVSTDLLTNSVRFGTTVNMTVGEQITISGTTIGLLGAGTYYVSQILDTNNVVLSSTLGGAILAQTSATGSMTAVVGVNTTLTTASGFLSGVAVCYPSFSYTTPSTTASFTGSLTGSTLTVTAIASGTLGTGQALSGPSTIPSTTSITAQLTPTGATALATPSLTAGGTTGTYTLTVSTNTGIVVGQIVTGTGVPVTTFVTNINGNVITLSNTFTTTGSGTYSFYTAYGIGTYSVSTSVGSPISSTPTFISVSGQATVTVSTITNHGFVPGQTVNISVLSESGTNNNTLVNGPFFVESVTSASTFTFTARAAGVISGTITANIYARPDSFYQHRPFDGGVQLGTGGPAYAAQAIRMSKKYIRYQSGKGINFNTGLLMAPNYFVRSVTANGTAIGSTITIVTDDVDHGCQVGAVVTLTGVITSGYNGTYTVSGIVDERTLQVVATQVLGTTSGTTGASISDPALLSLVNWYGASVRSGTYDEQNGVFFQYDGTTVSCVKRSSTFQLAGTISVTVGSGQIIGLNTRFSTQLTVGDRVVIRGMSHVITAITSDTLMYVNPQFRGYANLSGIKFTKTIDYVIPQSKWNGDRMDGSNGPFNPSGYQINVSKMQMVAVQWTWYGAGFIDWMMRGPEGKYVFVHRLRNNNLNNEAWMRTGNGPVRYEVQNEGARSYIVGTVAMSNVDTVMPLADATYLPIPTSGVCTVYVDNELMNYTGKINTYATATSASGNTVTVGSTTGMAVGQPIVFVTSSTAAQTMGNISANTTYYIVGTITANTIQVSATYNGSVVTQVNASGFYTVNALIGITRSQSITPWATGGYRTFTAGGAASHSTGTGVLLVNGSCSPIVSHWGAAFIEDGGFDSDCSYIFNYQSTNITLTTKKTTAFAIRLSPSVSNALTGDLGARELINRASFLLQGLESSSGTGGTNAAIVVEGVINPSNMPAISNIQFASMNSTVNPTGQPSFSQVAPGASMVFTNSALNTTTTTSATTVGTAVIPVASVANIAVGDDVFFPNQTNALYGLTKVSAFSSSSTVIGTGASATVAQGSAVTFTGSITGNTLTVTTAPSGSGITVGMTLSSTGTGTNITPGTYIVSNISGSGTASSSTWTVSQSQTVTSRTISAQINTLTIPFGNTSGGPFNVGYAVTGGTLPGGTVVVAQQTVAGDYSGTYTINANITISSGFTVTFTQLGSSITLSQPALQPLSSGQYVQISRATYALPGETVFSFINSPANKDSLDLSNLKELTNTPIGGRGTYPNGPDVLFVNAYITQGSPINANLVLRWGEAQA